MNVNINNIEPKTFGGILTTRQFLGICAGTIAAVCLIVYLPVPFRAAVDIGIITGILIYICFNSTRYGVNIALFALTYIFLNLLSPKIRTWPLVRADKPEKRRKFKEHSKQPGYEDFFG